MNFLFDTSNKWGRTHLFFDLELESIIKKRTYWFENETQRKSKRKAI